MQISRQTTSKWWSRFVREGTVGLVDRSSRPRRSPGRTQPELEAQILGLRTTRQLGPGAATGGILGIPASTVHRVLVRHGVNRLRWMDRPTGRVIRRIQTSRPGELIHIDVKRLARIPDGGGHKLLGHGQEAPPQRPALATPTSTRPSMPTRAWPTRSSPGLRTHPTAWRSSSVRWTALPITASRSSASSPTMATATAADCGQAHAIEWTSSTRTPVPTGRPPTARWSTLTAPLLDEWAYVRFYGSDAARACTLDSFVHRYNHHRYDTAVGGPPISRVNNVVGHYT